LLGREAIRMNPQHLPRLRSLQQENPTKRIRLIRLAWPDIEKALEHGHTLRLVHSRLIEDGLHISYSLLSLYVSRLQGKPPAKRRPRLDARPTDLSAPVLAARPASRPIDEIYESLRPPARDPARKVEEKVLLSPAELNRMNESSGPEGRCFFQERVPDINELFRVTKKSEEPPA
jgi:hypothetical protein